MSDMLLVDGACWPQNAAMKRRRAQLGVPEGRVTVSAAFQEPDRERMSLMLADAIEGLKDVAAGRLLNDAEVDRMLSVAPAKPPRKT
jgi:hypothetical protein